MNILIISNIKGLYLLAILSAVLKYEVSTSVNIDKNVFLKDKIIAENDKYHVRKITIDIKISFVTDFVRKILDIPSIFLLFIFL